MREMLLSKKTATGMIKGRTDRPLHTFKNLSSKVRSKRKWRKAGMLWSSCVDESQIWLLSPGAIDFFPYGMTFLFLFFSECMRNLINLLVSDGVSNTVLYSLKEIWGHLKSALSLISQTVSQRAILNFELILRNQNVLYTRIHIEWCFLIWVLW